MPKDNLNRRFRVAVLFSIFYIIIFLFSERSLCEAKYLRNTTSKISTEQNELLFQGFVKPVEGKSKTILLRTGAELKQILFQFSKPTSQSTLESKNVSTAIESVKTQSTVDTLINKQLLFQVLTGWRESQEEYIIQKEIAAWSAATIYVAGLLAMVGFILDKDKPLGWSLMSILFISIGVAGYSFTVFIHSHYSSLYEQNAVRAAITKCTSQLLDNKIVAPDLTLKPNETYPAFLLKERDELRVQVCRFQKSRSSEILKRLWTGRRAELNPLEQQEAAIYSILITATLCFYLITFTRRDKVFQKKVLGIIYKYFKKEALILSFIRKDSQSTTRS